ncbi:hypothetical protein [Helicobacter ganmani]
MALKTISGLTKITDTLRKIGGGGQNLSLNSCSFNSLILLYYLK